MFTRTIGRIVRGKATPFQLFTACVLGAMLGFMPGFREAPGLIVALTLLLIIFNANLPLAALVGVGAKLISLLLVPVTFAVGRWLLDGPFQGLFTWLINAPVFALFGFEYYVTTGGLFLGLILGLLVAIAVVRLVTLFRSRMASLEKGSERFNRFVGKRWVKVMTFVFVGGGLGKLTYEDLLTKKVGNPIRPLGVVFAVLVVVLLVLVQHFAAGPIVTAALQRGLERANGATVDLADAQLDLKTQRLTITGLAMADPNNLATDLFRAAKIEGQISGANLLRKRLQLDRVIVSDATSGESRRAPGHLVGPQPKPVPVEKPPGTKTIDDYLRDAKVWKERLAQARKWLEKLSGPEDTEERPETLQERLEREARELGYAWVRATHLIEGSPTFTVSELIAEKVRTAELPGETVDIVGRNLSTHPALLGKAPQLTIRSSGNTLDFETLVGSLNAIRSPNVIRLSYRGLPTERVAGNLVIDGTAPLQGGTIDLAFDGTWELRQGAFVDLPLRATLNDVTLSLPRLEATQIKQLVLPIGLVGPLDNPRVMVDDKQLTDALVKAGASQLVNQLKDKATDTLSREVGDKIGSKIGEQGKGVLDGILGGSKREKK
jgi:uncharacterized protein (TIGR03546 family)